MPSGVTGQAELRRVEARLLAVPKNLAREDAEALRKVAPDVARMIRAEIPSHVPRRMGYAEVLAGAMEFDARVKVGAGMTMTVWANGKRGHRDLASINRGVLRHPLFGNRNHWYAQRRGVRKGLVKDGVVKAEPLIVKAIGRAVDKVAVWIVR